MTDEAAPYEPNDDEFRGYGKPPEGGLEVPRYFYVGTNYGVGEPHYYVFLDESGAGASRGWWFEPEQAEALGKQLVELAQHCQQLNEEHEKIPVDYLETLQRKSSDSREQSNDD